MLSAEREAALRGIVIDLPQLPTLVSRDHNVPSEPPFVASQSAFVGDQHRQLMSSIKAYNRAHKQFRQRKAEVDAAVALAGDDQLRRQHVLQQVPLATVLGVGAAAISTANIRELGERVKAAGDTVVDVDAKARSQLAAEGAKTRAVQSAMLQLDLVIAALTIDFIEDVLVTIAAETSQLALLLAGVSDTKGETLRSRYLACWQTLELKVGTAIERASSSYAGAVPGGNFFRFVKDGSPAYASYVALESPLTDVRATASAQLFSDALRERLMTHLGLDRSLAGRDVATTKSTGDLFLQVWYRYTQLRQLADEEEARIKPPKAAEATPWRYRSAAAAATTEPAASAATPAEPAGT